MAAVTGAIIAAGSAGASFVQASNQRKLQQQAQADAAKALEEARKRTELNTYAALGVQKEPYALQREALLTQGAQSLQAAQEGDTRGVAATAGRIQAQQNQAQQQVTSAMGQEMSNLDKLKAQEESRLRDVNIQLDLGQVAGSQQLAADAAQKAAAANQAGFTQAASALTQAAQAAVPLFSKTPQMQTANVNALPATQLGTPAQQSLMPAYNQGIATMTPVLPSLYGQRTQMTTIPTAGLYQGQINAPYNPFQITLPQYP